MLVDADVLEARFSPDGKTLAYVAPDKSNPDELWQAHADGTHARRIDTHGLEPRDIQFAPDGKSLVFSTFGHYDKHDGGLYAVDLQSGKIRRLTREFGSDPAFSPDGKTLVYVCDGQDGGFDAELWSLDMASHQSKRLAGRPVREAVESLSSRCSRLMEAASSWREDPLLETIWMTGPTTLPPSGSWTSTGEMARCTRLT